MGQDFLSKAGRSIRRSVDRSLVALGTPDLFTMSPECTSRTVAAAISPDARVVHGKKLLVRLRGESVVVLDGITTVGTVSQPDPELVLALKQCPVRSATVTKILPFARTAEIKVN